MDLKLINLIKGLEKTPELINCIRSSKSIEELYDTLGAKEAGILFDDFDKSMKELKTNEKVFDSILQNNSNRGILKSIWDGTKEILDPIIIVLDKIIK